MGLGRQIKSGNAYVRCEGNAVNISGSLALTSPTLTTPIISGAISFPDNTRQTFNPGANAAGLNVGSFAGDPDTPSNGDLWYDSTANELTARINGANVALGDGSSYDESNPILDTSSNELLKFVKVASAVNEISISNNATGSAPIISATGGDTDIDIILTPKGSGSIIPLGTIERTFIESGSLSFLTAVGNFDHIIYSGPNGSVLKYAPLFSEGISIASNARCYFNGVYITTSGITFNTSGSRNLYDENGNEVLKFSSVASAVNDITISNNSTGNAPIISATGGDTNINIILTPKGTGGVVFSSVARLKSYTVAGLPSGVEGDMAYVTDQLTTPAAKGTAPTGGGSVKCVVFYNGSGWVGI